MNDRICTVPGCEKPARSGKAIYCKMHYHRWYRHGSTDRVATTLHLGNGRRYRTTHKPHHPIAGPSGRIYVHRMVLFDEIGYGPHPCHWCGTEVDWLPQGNPRELQPDHINGLGDDNRLENLVVSCRTCNQTRASQSRSDTLRGQGWWSGHDTIAALSVGRRARVEDQA